MPSAGVAILYLVCYVIVVCACAFASHTLLKRWSQKRLNLHPERPLTVEEVAAVNLGASGVVDVWLADLMLQKVLTPTRTVQGNHNLWLWGLQGQPNGATSVERVVQGDQGVNIPYKQWHTRLHSAANTFTKHLFGRPSYLLWGLSAPLWVAVAVFVYSTVAQVLGWPIAMLILAISVGGCLGVWTGIAASSTLSPIWAYHQLKRFRATHQSARMVPRRENLLSVVALIGLGGISQSVLARELGFVVPPAERDSGTSSCGSDIFSSNSGGCSSGDGGSGCGGGGCGD